MSYDDGIPRSMTLALAPPLNLLRKRHMMAICGASESGKTILARWLTRNVPRLVIDPSGAWGDEGQWAADPWDIVAGELRGGFEGAIVLDDGDRYVGTQGKRETWGTLWGSHRHLGVDVVIVTRLPDALPKMLWPSLSRVFVLRLPDDVGAEFLEKRLRLMPGETPREQFFAIDCNRWTGERRPIALHSLVKHYGNPAGR